MNAATWLWRQFNEERWPALILALSVTLLAAVAGVTPRLMSDLDDRQLGQALAGLSAIQGDIQASWAHDEDAYAPSGPVGDGPWPARLEAALAIRDEQPEPLRSLLAAPEFIGRANRDVEFVPAPETGYYLAVLTLLVDPQLSQHAALVDGAWPVSDPGGEQTQVAVLADVAEKMKWSVGSSIGEDYVVSATFRPVEPSAHRWEHVPLGRTYTEPLDPNLGVAMNAGLFLPEAYTPLAGDLGTPRSWDSGMTIRMWFGLDVEALRSSGVDVVGLSAQLTALLSQRYESSTAESAQDIRLNSELGSTLTRVVAQQNLTRSILTVAALGPIAVAVALVILAARLVLQRRQTWLELLHARGLTPGQARRMAIVEGGVLAGPTAVAGHLLAVAVIPGPQAAAAWLTAVLAAVVAIVALGVGTARAGARRTRSDISSRAGRWRVVGEALVWTGAVAATLRLLGRPDDGATLGVDLLGSATPVLWTLAATLLALRLYPLPLSVLARWTGRRPGLTGFLGAARSLRDPAGGVVPVTTVLLGVTLAVMGATLVGTITTGTERAAWSNNGSHIHLSGPRVLDPMVEQLRAVDGVAGVARLYEASGNAKVTLDGGERWVRVLLADPELMAVYEPTPGGAPVPSVIFDEPALVLGGDLSATSGRATVTGLGELRVAGQVRVLPGASPGSAWLLADVNRWRDRAPTATTALISVAPGVDVRQIATEIAQLVPNSRVTNVADQLAQLRGSPTIDGLSRAFVILTVTAAVLMALSVIGSQLLSGGERRHLAAILRTLGQRPGQLRALAAWEVAPAIVLALVVGVGMGIGLAALMLAGLDFRSVTGGSYSPTLQVNWPTLAGVIGALLATMTVAVAVTAWSAGRTDLAKELRIGDQR